MGCSDSKYSLNTKEDKKDKENNSKDNSEKMRLNHLNY